MIEMSAKDAQRRYFAMLKAADESVVLITRRGRPRTAVMSVKAWRAYQRVFDHCRREAALASFTRALALAKDGRLGEAEAALRSGRFLAGAEQERCEPGPARVHPADGEGKEGGHHG